MLVLSTFGKFVFLSCLYGPSIAKNIWCGKVYQQGYVHRAETFGYYYCICGGADYMDRSDLEVIPGGRIEPARPSLIKLIDVGIRPRMSLYLDGERTGSFILDTTVWI